MILFSDAQLQRVRFTLLGYISRINDHHPRPLADQPHKVFKDGMGDLAVFLGQAIVVRRN